MMIVTMPAFITVMMPIRRAVIAVVVMIIRTSVAAESEPDNRRRDHNRRRRANHRRRFHIGLLGFNVNRRRGDYDCRRCRQRNSEAETDACLGDSCGPE